MNAFSKYHPAVLLLYFAEVTIITMFTLNPILLAASFLGALCCFAMLCGFSALLKSMVFYLGMFFIIALTNPIFSPVGETVLFSFLGVTVTRESLLYGFAAAAMLVSVMCWFRCYNEVMTTDKFLFLFGKALPKLSLIMSSALRFAPLFRHRISEVAKVQKTLGLYSSKSIYDRLHGSIRVFSAIVTWSLENAVETAQSMNARGYALRGGTRFSLFKFTSRDAVITAALLLLALTVMAGMQSGELYYTYFPTISAPDMSAAAVLAQAAAAALMLLPSIIVTKENITWKLLRSEI